MLVEDQTADRWGTTKVRDVATNARPQFLFFDAPVAQKDVGGVSRLQKSDHKLQRKTLMAGSHLRRRLESTDLLKTCQEVVGSIPIQGLHLRIASVECERNVKIVLAITQR